MGIRAIGAVVVSLLAVSVVSVDRTAGAAGVLSDACQAANDPVYDTTYADSDVDGPGGLAGFFAGETLTVSATGAPQVIAMLIDGSRILIDAVGPELTVVHTWGVGQNTARWTGFLDVLNPPTAVAGDWTVSCTGPLPVVSPFGVIVTEGAAGTATVVQLPVTLSAPAAQPVTVDYATIDHRAAPEATSGLDFTPTSGTLTFSPGETVAHVPIEILGDDEAEVPLYGGEWGLVQFSAVSANAALDTDTFFGAGLVIIVDDDERVPRF